MIPTCVRRSATMRCQNEVTPATLVRPGVRPTTYSGGVDVDDVTSSCGAGTRGTE